MASSTSVPVWGPPPALCILSLEPLPSPQSPPCSQLLSFPGAAPLHPYNEFWATTHAVPALSLLKTSISPATAPLLFTASCMTKQTRKKFRKVFVSRMGLLQLQSIGQHTGFRIIEMCKSELLTFWTFSVNFRIRS